MKELPIGGRLLLTLLALFIFVAPTRGETDEEYKKKIEDAIKKNLGEGNDKVVTFACPAEGEAPEKLVGCTACVKGVNAANLDYTIEFRTPQETSKLVGSNVDINEQDEDFSIKHYIAAFVKSCKLVLNNEQLKETIVKKLKAVAEALTLKVNEDGAATLDYILLAGEGADKRSNNAIAIKIDLATLSITFKTNFFESTFSISMRHSLFVEAEVERAIKQMNTDLSRMRKLLGNEKEDKTTMNTLTCEAVLAAPYVAEALKARVEALTWQFAPAEKEIVVTAGEKVGTLVCEEVLLDGKIGILKWTLKYEDVNKTPLVMSQAFLKSSMYDLNAIVEAYLNDMVTFLLRFYGTTNPEEKVDFGKKQLVEGAGGAEGGAGGGEGRRLIDQGDSQSERLEEKRKEKKTVKQNQNKKW